MGKRSTLAVSVVTVAALQLLLPLGALLLPDKPNRLGWQMFSGVGEHEVVVKGADGRVIEVPWDEVLPKGGRPELDWTRNLPEHLCSVLDQTSLTVEDGPAARTVTC